MKKSLIVSVSLATAFFLGVSVLSVFADWTPPGNTPPTCPSGQPGCDAPVNVGPSAQSKSGNLGIGGNLGVAETSASSLFPLEVNGKSNFLGSIGVGGQVITSGDFLSTAGNLLLEHTWGGLWGNASWNGTGFNYVGTGPAFGIQQANTSPTSQNLVFSVAPNGTAGSAISAWNYPLQITPAGNIGIGTGAPVAKLHIDAGSSVSSAEVAIGDGSSSSGGNTYLVFGRSSATNGAGTIDAFDSGGGTPGVLALQASIGASGSRSVGINTMNPGATLDVNGTIRIQSGAQGGTPQPGYVLTSLDTHGLAAWKQVASGGVSGITQLSQDPSNPGIVLTPNPITTTGTVGVNPALVQRRVSSCSSGAIQTINQDGSVGCVAVGGGGATTPGGSNGQVQFNNNNSFGGSSNLFWDNPDGSLNINTSNPQTGVSLFVVGQPANVTNSNTVASFQSKAATSYLNIGNAGGWSTISTQGNDLYLGGSSGLENIFFRTGDQTSSWDSTMVLNSSGNLGIGTTNPQAKLSVGFNNGDMINMYSPSDNHLSIQTTLDGQPLGTYGGDNQNQLSLQPLVGNVGIGTTNPQAKLSVGFNNGDMFNVYSPADNTLAVQTSLDGQPIGTYGQDTTNTLLLQPTIGRVGIGTLSPGAKLDVAGTVKATGFQLPTGAAAGKFLTSDASGNASWVPAPTGPGSGITQLDQGNGVLFTPNPITTTGTIAADITYLQKRVTGTCPTGAIQSIDSGGGVTCSTPSGTLTGSCPAGTAIQAINADGTITCSAPAAKTTFYTVDSTRAAWANTLTMTAVCNTGDTVTGGGMFTAYTGGTTGGVGSSYPSSVNTLSCTADTPGGTFVTCRAICVHVP